jgi:hypothetical protein
VNGWFDEVCQRAFDRRNEARKEMLQRGTRDNALEYSDERIESKIMCHIKKKEHERNIIQKLQDRYSRNVQKFYEGVSNFKREFKSRISVCRDKTGNMIFGEQHILNIWAFGDL